VIRAFLTLPLATFVVVISLVLIAAVEVLEAIEPEEA